MAVEKINYGGGLIETKKTVKDPLTNLDTSTSTYTYGNKPVTKDNVLTLMSSGITVPSDVVFSVGLGGENDHMFAHKNSPARDAMKSQFDSLYGTKGQREIAYQFANASGVSPADMDRIAGQKFAEELKSGTYSVYDPKSVSAIGNHALDYIQYRSKVPIPTEARTALDSYNQEVFKLTQIPHPKRSGFIKQIVSDIAGFATEASSNVAGALGLDKYSSAILTAGLTALGVPPNIAAGLAAAAPSMAAGEFGDALKGAGVGFVAGQAGQAAGGLLAGATGNAVVDNFLTKAAGGAVAGGTGALLTNKNFGQGLAGGLVTAGVNSFATNAANRLYGVFNQTLQDVGGDRIQKTNAYNLASEYGIDLSGVAEKGFKEFLSSEIKDVVKPLVTAATGTGTTQTGTSNPLTQSPTNTTVNPLTQPPTETGTTMSGTNTDYVATAGNLLSGQSAINNLNQLSRDVGGLYTAAAAPLNRPFTAYNVTSGAGTTNVAGNQITSTLSPEQQALANLAPAAAGMFGDVNIPGVTGVRDAAMAGAQSFMQQAQGFNPQQAAQQEYEALQALYAPSREREALSLENRLRAQGRLGASDNPALRQMYEAQSQQDLAAAIQSRNLGFQRQQELQTLGQGMFTTGSQAAQLPTTIQGQRADIGRGMAATSQLPYTTLNQQQQATNQLAQARSGFETSMLGNAAEIQAQGARTQAEIGTKAVELENQRNSAVIEGMFGSGLASGVTAGAASSGLAQTANVLVNQGVNAAISWVKSLFPNASADQVTEYLNSVQGMDAPAVDQADYEAWAAEQ